MRVFRLRALLRSTIIISLLFLCSACEEDEEKEESSADSHIPISPTDPTSFDAQPYLGVNLTTYGDQLEGYSIIQNYDQKEVWEKVQSDLTTMREGGAQTLRMLIWHFEAEDPQDWGVIPHFTADAEVGMPEPYRTNFINFVTDVKNAGYGRLTVGFAPSHTSNPQQDWENCQADFFDDQGQSQFFENNWQFIQDVRALAKEHGPDQVRFDLSNEGVSNEWVDASCPDGKSTREQIKQYGIKLIDRYVEAYGDDDVTISAITSALVTCPTDSTFGTEVLEGSLSDLIEMFGDASPAWFALHMYHSQDDRCSDTQKVEAIYESLVAADTYFDSVGKTDVPFVIQETFHNDADVAAQVARFLEGNDRPIEELMSWPHVAGSSEHVDVAPPYSLDNYSELPR